MVVGSPKYQVSQHSRKPLIASASVVGLVSAWAPKLRADMVRVIGVEPLLNGAGRHRKGSASCGGFDRLKIQPIGGTGSNQRFDLTDDLEVERFFEPPFLAASFELAWGACRSKSAHCSQASQ
jgi:hypothetical protein